uniref:H-type lectin domain-containing protein n=1 Tax=Magallana gigas TaxID=29159 RepID=A0A8W8L454_MAGGI
MGLIAEVLLLVTAVAISGTVQSQNSNDERQNRSGNALVFHLMEQLYNMKFDIAAQKKQIEALQNRESGTAGQHKAPPPGWPYIENVKFKSPFEETPTVTYGLFLLDSLHNTNVRISTTVTAVTKTGFRVQISPWDDTRLYGARISWMACGK